MPSSADILSNLSAAARGSIPIALMWHVILASAGVAFALGWRPSQRRASLLLALPLASVALIAIAFNSPFNAIVFAHLAIAQALLAQRGSAETLPAVPATASAIGLLMLGIGWVYPHFLAGLGPSVYLYAAPLGVVPCATLYAVIGLALLGAVGSRTASNVLAGAGLLYGTFGLLQLGVRLDLGLVIGSAALAVLRSRSNRALGTHPA